MSRDRATALQPGRQSETPSQSVNPNLLVAFAGPLSPWVSGVVGDAALLLDDEAVIVL